LIVDPHLGDVAVAGLVDPDDDPVSGAR
jgi:hypothetical protein